MYADSPELDLDSKERICPGRSVSSARLLGKRKKKEARSGGGGRQDRDQRPESQKLPDDEKVERLTHGDILLSDIDGACGRGELRLDRGSLHVERR